jgi:nitrite reductase/ring-hydroxylating ferredoxin subunit
VAKVGDIAAGGLKFVKLGGAQAALANCDGTFFAVGRRCGHMNAPLDRYFGAEPLPAAARHVLDVEQRLQRKIRVDGLATWPVRVTGESIEVDL